MTGTWIYKYIFYTSEWAVQNIVYDIVKEWKKRRKVNVAYVEHKPQTKH